MREQAVNEEALCRQAAGRITQAALVKAVMQQHLDAQVGQAKSLPLPPGSSYWAPTALTTRHSVFPRGTSYLHPKSSFGGTGTFLLGCFYLVLRPLQLVFTIQRPFLCMVVLYVVVI